MYSITRPILHCVPTSTHPQLPERYKGERKRLFSFFQNENMCATVFSLTTAHVNKRTTWILACFSQRGMDTWCRVHTHTEHLCCWECKQWLRMMRYGPELWKKRCLKGQRWSSTDICNPCTVWYNTSSALQASQPVFSHLKFIMIMSAAVYRYQDLVTWSSLYHYYYLYAIYRATCMQREAQLFYNFTPWGHSIMAFPHLFLVFSDCPAVFIGYARFRDIYQVWVMNQVLPEASRDTIPVRAHKDSSNSAQSILEIRPRTIWGRDAQTQHF